ncbi:MAG: rod shape-determining protein MreC [Syntrophales bacterium]|nr:rod shape-determining protein MreC [Syntrophales bacterium]
MIRRFRTPIILVLIGGFFLFLAVYNIHREEPTSFLRKLIVEGAVKLRYLLDYPLKSAKEAWQKYIFLVGVTEENKRLKKEIDRLLAQVANYREAYEENKRLRNLLKLDEELRLKHLTARVIGMERKSPVKAMIINRGSSHGVKRNDPVITDRGLVGRVIEPSWQVSRVLLIIDETSCIDAILQTNRVQGIVQGTGRGCSIKYVGKTDEVKVGEAVVTAGISHVFPKGLLIGYVSRVDWREGGMFKKVEVEPAVDFSRLEEVMVIIGQDERK